MVSVLSMDSNGLINRVCGHSGDREIAIRFVQDDNNDDENSGVVVSPLEAGANHRSRFVGRRRAVSSLYQTDSRYLYFRTLLRRTLAVHFHDIFAM